MHNNTKVALKTQFYDFLVLGTALLKVRIFFIPFKSLPLKFLVSLVRRFLSHIDHLDKEKALVLIPRVRVYTSLKQS